jgi:L-amino acid N-acyltransferase YncA
VKLRRAEPSDAVAIAAIYAPYVTDSAISFEAEPPGADEVEARMDAGADLYPWLVAEDGPGLLGYAHGSAFRTRPAYRFTVETTIYLAPAAQGRGAGRALYGALLDILARQGFAQAVGAITLPNAASVGLHEALGFVEAGRYRRVGWKFGRWHDVGLWQKELASLDKPTEPRRLSEVG